MTDTYVPPHLQALVDQIVYKPGWKFRLSVRHEDDGSGGLQLQITSDTVNSFNFERRIAVLHSFLVSDWATAAKSSGDV